MNVIIRRPKILKSVAYSIMESMVLQFISRFYVTVITGYLPFKFQIPRGFYTLLFYRTFTLSDQLYYEKKLVREIVPVPFVPALFQVLRLVGRLLFFPCVQRDSCVSGGDREIS